MKSSAVGETSNDFAMMGTESWCRREPELWCSQLYSTALFAASILNNVEGLPADWNAYVKVTQAQCWLLPSDEVSLECSAGGGACPFGLDVYPLGDGGGTQLWSRGWQGFEQSVAAFDLAGVTPLPVEMVGIQDLAGGTGASGVTPNPYETDLNSLGGLGASVVGLNVTNRGHGGVLAHEFGHSLGLAHDYHFDGFMHVGAGGAPVLGAVDVGDVSGNGPNFQNRFPLSVGDQTDALLFTGKAKEDLPRPNGFVFSPCTSNSDCQPNGWPGVCDTQEGHCDYAF